MDSIAHVSDRDLLALMPGLVLLERAHSADVIEHLVEIDRRRLYLDAACASLSSYCAERLGYSEDEAAIRVRVTRLACRLPQVLVELRSGRIHLTGLCTLGPYLTPENSDELLAQARGKSKRQLEQLLAARFPKPNVPDRIQREPEQLSAFGSTAAPDARQATRSGPGMDLALGHAKAQPNRVAPLSEKNWSVQFTADDALRDKIEQVLELLSHVLPSGDLAVLFERALDALIERETKRRFGAATGRKRRKAAADSRHIPVEIAREVRERDRGQCTFVDEQGRRCSARRFMTFEHVHPYALGGPTTAANLCLRCQAHNAQAARKVFGDAYIEARRAEREEVERKRADVHAKARVGLCKMGFPESKVRRVLAELAQRQPELELESLLRTALGILVPSNVAKSTAAP